MSDIDIKRDAVISECGKYRYVLTRVWDKDLPSVIYIMLNPSTADGTKDDATIRVCMGRAMRMKAGGIIVLNLYAFRATSPADMMKASDPVGPKNDAFIQASLIAEQPMMTIAAWGTHGYHLNRGERVANMLTERFGQTVFCLGTSKGGYPKHPLRIGYDVRPRQWRPEPAKQTDNVVVLH